jgi:hypothetical protein
MPDIDNDELAIFPSVTFIVSEITHIIRAGRNCKSSALTRSLGSLPQRGRRKSEVIFAHSLSVYHHV